MRHYETALADCSLSVTQFAVLRALERHGDMPLTALARTMVMERTSLYRTLAPLEEQGHVKVTPAEGRSKIAALTKSGRQQIEKVLPYWEGAQKTVVDLIGEAEWERVSALLLAIPDLLETRP